ncbi:MAG: hypothetical protein WB443_09260, partial [Nitrososphaeraceae archaeon]
ILHILQYFFEFILEYRHSIVMCYFPNEDSFYTLSFTIKQDAPGIMGRTMSILLDGWIYNCC